MQIKTDYSLLVVCPASPLTRTAGPSLIKHLDNEKSGSHRGWRIGLRTAAAPPREIKFYDPLSVTRIKCNKYLNDMESESISANPTNKKRPKCFLGRCKLSFMLFIQGFL